MKSIRLLPIVIFAALALLLFKGIGLVTSGGYVLTGPAIVAANEEGGAGEGADAAMTLPQEAVLTDSSPTLGDTAPTLAAARADASGEAEHGSSASSDGAHGSSASSGDEHGSSVNAEASAPEAQGSDPHGSSEAGDVACLELPRASSTPTELTDKIGSALANGCPPPPTPINEYGDALPTTKDGNGKIVPLAIVDGDNSEQALLSRLAERRGELDKIATDLEIRTALVQAAEKRLDERTKALEELEAQVNALVDEKQVTEDAGFKAVVSMYENMKPKEAAAIFDTLDIEVLLRVVRAMNPRKMSPVLAAMSTKPAEELTTALASKGPSNTVADAGTNMAELPQIVGQ